MAENDISEKLIAANSSRTIIVKKDKKENLYKVGSKLFLVFNIITIVYTVLFTLGCLFYYLSAVFKAPSGLKQFVKFVFTKNNEQKLAEAMKSREVYESQIKFLNENVSYYRWKVIPYFLKNYVYGGLKAVLRLLNPKLIVIFLLKDVIYGLPKEIVKNLFFKTNNYYYLALTAYSFAMITLLHFQKFQQKTLRVIGEMSNYDAMSINYLQIIVLIFLAFISTPAFLKLFPFMAVSLASVLKGEQRDKVNYYIPMAFVGSVIPYLTKTLILNSGEGFVFLLYTMIIVLKCKFNKFDNLVLLRIVAILDTKIAQKWKKSDATKEEKSKYRKWNGFKKAVIADTVGL
ncbi:hypothetical protein QEN19_004170 [Hanseniaspora menglaensis]